MKDIIELNYGQGKRVVLFECDWVTKGRRLKLDSDGFTLANFENIKRQNERFALASQVQQVFYVEDPSEKGWYVVIKTNARAKFEDGKDLAINNVDVILQSAPCNESTIDENEDMELVREGVPPTPA